MKKNLLLFVSMVFLIFFVSGCVSASDINTDYTVISSENEIDDVSIVDYNSHCSNEINDFSKLSSEKSEGKENVSMDVSFDVEDLGDEEFNLNIEIFILPEDATGNVTASYGDNNYTGALEYGICDIIIPGLGIEKYNISLIYSGDDNYNSVTDYIQLPYLETDMDISAEDIEEGKDAIITVVFSEFTAGTVTAAVEGINYTDQVKDGVATLIIPNLIEGVYNIPVYYSGDLKYYPISKEVNISVIDVSDIVTVQNLTKYYGGFENLEVYVTDYAGNVLINKSVSFTINGVTYTRLTDEKGIASIDINLLPGVYNASIVVDNNTFYSIVTIQSTINASDVVKVFRNDTQYYATFRDREGDYLYYDEVEFNINGVSYYRQVGAEGGLACLNINLAPGDYIITAINPYTNEMISNNITVISRLIENYDITKYFKNDTGYSLLVLGDDGKAVGAGINVTFNINGVLYTRQTNASGFAKLNINLAPGDYIITAEYNGCLVSNKIEVLSVLSANDLTKTYATSDQFVATLVDGRGNPFANQQIQFNINGVLYYRTTDDEGNAKLNINLIPGEYIITSTYNGMSISNTVKVNS